VRQSKGWSEATAAYRRPQITNNPLLVDSLLVFALRFQTYHVTYSVHVPGRPNAAPEAFTKACCSQIPPFFASKIPETLKNHSRSYGRVYTTIATKGTKEFDEMEDVYKTYPTATVGSSIIVIPYLKGDKKCEEIAGEISWSEGLERSDSISRIKTIQLVASLLDLPLIASLIDSLRSS